MGNFTDLPLDILVDILPYLEPADFLNLCATCKGLAQPSIRNESSYWSGKTRTTFRVPNRPAVDSDGLRWRHLYKRLRTQSRVYTWGQNTRGCLGRRPGNGRDMMDRAELVPGLPRTYGEPVAATTNTWPDEMDGARGLGVIADLQCGGWSTSLLTDGGAMYTVGVLNGMTRHGANTILQPLKFPPRAVQAEDKSESYTTIKQFSSGRTHILGLSDDGTIWSWCDSTTPSVDIDLLGLESHAQSVIAGWNKSSAYIKGHGIVLWEIWGDNHAPRTVAEVHDWTLVPRTGYRRPRAKSHRLHTNQSEAGERTEEGNNIGDEVGEVTSYIVLENFVVFVTDLQKAFATRIQHNPAAGIAHDIFELPELNEAKDVQGSFRTFAVFKGEGEVLIADQDYLEACSRRELDTSNENLPPLKVIPALQNTGVVQLAFGDYHYHALHSDGSISSYGVEPDSCGALGLGGSMDVNTTHGMLRGIEYGLFNRDAVLLPHAYSKGRRIWFQKEKDMWIRHVIQGGADKKEADDRMSMIGTFPHALGQVSEWIEQMGADWDKRPEVAKIDKDGLGAHFALSVTAAGWHSGALVLVNDEVVEAVRQSCLMDDPNAGSIAEASTEPRRERRSMISLLTDLARNSLGLRTESGPSYCTCRARERAEQDSRLPPEGKKWIWTDASFPRLRLEGGVEMPGEVEFDEWKEELPDWKLRWLGEEAGGRVFGVQGWEIVGEGSQQA